MLALPRVRLTLLFVFALAIAFTQSPGGFAGPRWYKGNLHTHTLNSDGDSTPHEVATWYREHGYQFLVLTDHNYLTDVAGLNSLHAAKEKFLLIAGEEVTANFKKSPVHINAFQPSGLIAVREGDSLVATIQNNVNAIREAGALPSLNHPNFHWAISAKDLLQVRNLGLFEVYNGHPTVNNKGGGGFQSLDEMWDTLLSAGRRIHGVAVDDAHHFKKMGQEFSNPGRGWVNVRAAELSPAAIMAAIDKGDFYSSSGVVLSDVSISGGEYKVEITERPQEKFTTYFIGEGGKVLGKSSELKPVYHLAAGDKYVRARVDSSFGSSAWTQPLFR